MAVEINRKQRKDTCISAGFTQRKLFFILDQFMLHLKSMEGLAVTTVGEVRVIWSGQAFFT